jgi:hypothetical protein
MSLAALKMFCSSAVSLALNARTTGTAQGLTGRALEVFVAQAAMNAK